MAYTVPLGRDGLWSFPGHDGGGAVRPHDARGGGGEIELRCIVEGRPFS